MDPSWGTGRARQEDSPPEGLQVALPVLLPALSTSSTSHPLRDSLPHVPHLQHPQGIVVALSTSCYEASELATTASKAGPTSTTAAARATEASPSTVAASKATSSTEASPTSGASVAGTAGASEAFAAAATGIVTSEAPSFTAPEASSVTASEATPLITPEASPLLPPSPTPAPKSSPVLPASLLPSPRGSPAPPTLSPPGEVEVATLTTGPVPGHTLPEALEVARIRFLESTCQLPTCEGGGTACLAASAISWGRPCSLLPAWWHRYLHHTSHQRLQWNVPPGQSLPPVPAGPDQLVFAPAALSLQLLQDGIGPHLEE